jgi:RNA recognition motif-containing protein
MNIFVGNLSFDATEADLKKLFEGFGAVASVVIVLDEKGKKSRGFGFIEMQDASQGQKAIDALDGQIFMSRPMRVNPVKPKSELVKEIGDQKEARKRIKAEKRRSVRGRAVEEKREFLGGRRTYSGVRLSAAERYEQPKHWEKREPGAKPWVKREAGAKPWQKREAGTKPWVKREAGAKPWVKREPGAKPWQKREAGAKPWVKREPGAKPWLKREGSAKPWEKRERTETSAKRTPGKSRPWEKRPGPAKPWQKNKTRGYQR